MALRAVIFGLEGTLIKEGNPGLRRDIVYDLQRLFEFLRLRNVEPVILSNRDFINTNLITGAKRKIDDALNERFGHHSIYITKRMGLPPKPRRDAVDVVLKQLGLSPSETIYIGNSMVDFQTAINSGILFLNATWDRQEIDYGFTFSSPKDIARFIDTFGLKAHPWFYQIDEPIQYRSLAPYSTYSEDYKDYSEAARSAAKAGTRDRHFFLRSLVGSLYFSGLTTSFDYVACIPGHNAGYGNPSMNDVLDILGKCFRKPYIRDLILRHTSAPKSQNLRKRGITPQPESQLNTIVLLQYPQKSAGIPYKTPVKLKGKKVLVLDDFCTAGFSLEAARLFLKQAGAESLLISWLKTINSNYKVVHLKRDFNPYKAQTFDRKDIQLETLPYRNYIVDRVAPDELREAFERYKYWDYPI